MKNIIAKMLIGGVLILLSACSNTQTNLSIRQSPQPPVYNNIPVASQIFVKKGAVKIVQNMQEIIITANQKYSLSVGDLVQVRDHTVAQIYWLDNSISRLAPNTELVITQLAQDQIDATSTQVALRVIVGRLWSKVAPLVSDSSLFEVTHNSIVAGVRGTSFDFKVALNAVPQITVGEHEVVVKTLNTLGQVVGKKIIAEDSTSTDPWIKQNQLDDKNFAQYVIARQYAKLNNVLRLVPNDLSPAVRSLKFQIMQNALLNKDRTQVVNLQKLGKIIVEKVVDKEQKKLLIGALLSIIRIVESKEQVLDNVANFEELAVLEESLVGTNVLKIQQKNAQMLAYLVLDQIKKTGLTPNLMRYVARLKNDQNLVLGVGGYLQNLRDVVTFSQHYPLSIGLNIPLVNQDIVGGNNIIKTRKILSDQGQNTISVQSVLKN